MIYIFYSKFSWGVSFVGFVWCPFNLLKNNKTEIVWCVPLVLRTRWPALLGADGHLIYPRGSRLQTAAP